MEGWSGGQQWRREASSGKVTLADPIRVSHLFILLRAREDLTQAEACLQYHMNAWALLILSTYRYVLESHRNPYM